MAERDYGTAEFDPVSGRILGLAITVHRRLGPGLLESAYEECLAYELHNNGIEYRRQVSMPVTYDEVELECGYRLDLLVENTVIVELKAVERLVPLHEAQMLTYLKLSGLRIGLILNFNVPVLREGIRRMLL